MDPAAATAVAEGVVLAAKAVRDGWRSLRRRLGGGTGAPGVATTTAMATANQRQGTAGSTVSIFLAFITSQHDFQAPHRHQLALKAALAAN